MKKIGFIDYFLDHAHANSYPRFIRENALGGDFEVALAWEEISTPGGRPIDKWCAEMGIAKAESIEQVVEECDCIVVLSPADVDRHEDLSSLALASGKPVYIDKALAESLPAAKRIVERANAHGTPLMACSPLRFDSTVTKAIEQRGDAAVRFVSARGTGEFRTYAVHQVEPMVALMGVGAKRVMQCGGEFATVMVVDYGDGRRGVMNMIPSSPFQFTASYEGGVVVADKMGDYNIGLIDAMLRFFATGQSPIPIEQTLQITAILEAGEAALNSPEQWVAVPT